MSVNNYFRLKVDGKFTSRDVYPFDDNDAVDARLAYQNARDRAQVWARTYGEAPPKIVVMRQPRAKGPWSDALVVGNEPQPPGFDSN